MKEFQLFGLGNALVDIFVEVSEEEFASLGFERGSSRLVDRAEQEALLGRFAHHNLRLVSGGSVANSVIAFSQLGGDAAFLGCVGDDRYGLFYQTEFEELGIDSGQMVLVGETTGTCLCIITPDAERTMRTCLAGAGRLAAQHVDEQRVKNAAWVFIEGYGFANPETLQEAIRTAVRFARQHGNQVAVTCSEAFIVTGFRAAFNDVLKQTGPAVLQRGRGLRGHRGRLGRGLVPALQGDRPLGGGHGRRARALCPLRRRRGACARVSLPAGGLDGGRRHDGRGVPLRRHP